MSIEKQVIGDCTLFRGDCRDILPTLTDISVVAMDPPYGIEELVGGYGRDGHKIENDKNLDVCCDALKLIAQHFRKCWIFSFYSSRISPQFFECASSLEYFGEIMWDKKAPGMGNAIRYQHENIAVFKQGNPTPLSAIFSIVQAYRDPEKHPHQKPIALMRRLIEITTGRVLDAFMGSGSTGVACAKLGRPFVGVELTAEYFDIACRRIEEAYGEPELFAAPAVDTQASIWECDPALAVST